MKRILLLIIICLAGLCSLTTHAQTLAGAWTSSVRELLDLDASLIKKADCVLTFSNDSTATMTFDVNVLMSDTGLTLDAGVKMLTAGKYAQDDKSVTIAIDAEQSTTDLYRLDLKLGPTMERALADAGMTKAQMAEVVKDQLELDRKIKALGDFSGVFSIRTLTATQLVLAQEDGVTLTFKRK